MLRRWLALVLVGAAVFVGASFAISAARAHPPVRPVAQRGPLVVVSMPGLSWTDVSPRRTPTLWALAQRGAVAALTTRIYGARSCPNQSWLTFSAGRRAALAHVGGGSPPGVAPGPCPEPPVPQARQGGTVAFPYWASWRHDALTRAPPAHIGRLATALGAQGQCVAAAGERAALGAADEQGVVARYTPRTARVDLTACPVTFVSLPGPRDGSLAALVRRLPADATIVVAGLADGAAPTTLHTVVVAGPGVPHGRLSSLSTRQPGFLQTTDLSALVLARLGAAAPVLPEGRAPVVQPATGATGPVSQVTGLTRELNLEQPFVPIFFALFLGGAALAVVIGLVWWWLAHRDRDTRDASRTRQRLPRWWFAIVGALCASMPMATFVAGLVPWWRAGHPRLALSLVVVAVSVVLTGLALLGPWRRWVGGPTAFLLTATLFVIGEDVVHGSGLQLTSLMGLQPVYGGRYFGMGNVGYAVYATSALLLAALVAGRIIDSGHRRVAGTVVALLGLAAVFVDGYPSWGADGGGPVALIPAFAYLALSAAGVSLTWRRLLVIAGATVAVVGGFAVLDYLRPPPYRTHLGDFVAQLRHTGQPTGLENIVTQNWTMLTSTWLNVGVVLLLIAILVALVRPRALSRLLQPVLGRVTFLGHGLAAIGVCWLLAFFANDSGTAIPPAGFLVVATLLILLAACVHGSRSATAPGRATTPDGAATREPGRTSLAGR